MEKELLEILKQYNKLKEMSVSSEEVINCTKRLFDYLNTKFPCDIEAFSNFADMYRQADFKKNIDTVTEEGTAEFIAEAIENYCYN